MPLDHLQNKRTGRPRGSKSSSPLKRDPTWAYRNLGKDVDPPTDGARFWTKMAHEQPEKFVAAVAQLDAVNTRPREEQKVGFTATKSGQQFKVIFLTEKEVWRSLRSYRAGLPEDARLFGCALTRGGAIFTLSSATFRPLAEGEPIPELRPLYAT